MADKPSGSDPSDGLGDADEELRKQIAQLQAMVVELYKCVQKKLTTNPPQQERERYTVKEFAELVNRKPYTVREWCRHKRIRSNRDASKRFRISHAEYLRFKDNGLL